MRKQLFITTLLIIIATTTTSSAYALPCPMPHPTLQHVTVKHHTATRHQRRMLTRILNVGHKMRAPRRANIAAIAATTQEASANNLPYGTGTSVGLFQLISLHGTFQWRMIPENSARWFYQYAITINRQRPYLSAAGLAQAVERSAYPAAYNAWITEAQRTYYRYITTCT